MLLLFVAIASESVIGHYLGMRLSVADGRIVVVGRNWTVTVVAVGVVESASVVGRVTASGDGIFGQELLQIELPSFHVLFITIKGID